MSAIEIPARSIETARPGLAAPIRDTGPVRTWYPPYKHAVERVLSLVLLILSAPLLIVIGIMIRSESAGGAFYVQSRLGQLGRIYRIYKLRTMREDSERETGPVWAADDDARATSIGRFLRETHLDELPQFWNVACGEMSLIGPRPERPELAADIELSAPRYRERLLVRPGLTGLAQIELPADRGLDDVCRKLNYDLYYVRHCGPILDLRIALSTFLHLFGLFAHAVGKRLIRSCRTTIEQSPETQEMPEELFGVDGVEEAGF